MNRLTDTSPEAHQVLIEAYRQMPIGRKWLTVGDSYQTARVLHAAGVRFRNRDATPEQVRESWLTLNLGCPVPCALQGTAMDQPLQNLPVIREVVTAFESLGIPYALGGSVASSLYGIVRFTRDADITVEPFAGKEAQLLACFGPDYYVSLTAVEEAIRNRTAFNIINTRLGFKVDVFVCTDQPFEEAAMARRVPVDLPDAPGHPITLHSPEDVVLFKMRWYRLGNESAGQQWADILGVLQVQAGKLDNAYLKRWASVLGVADLLQRARLEAGA